MNFRSFLRRSFWG